MRVLDMILNLAGLLIWLNWRSVPWALREKPAQAPPQNPRARSSAPLSNRVLYLAGLMLLLLVRPLFYWQVGPSLDWLPTLSWVAVHLPFRSDYLGRMYEFSLLSFGQVLMAFYLCLLLLSAVSRQSPDSSYFQLWVKKQLGRLDRIPSFLKWLAPFLSGFFLWLLLGPLFIQEGMLAELRSPTHLLQQAAVIGLAGYLSWKLFLVLWLLLHILNNYIFLGNFAFWNYLNHTAQVLLRPLAWLPVRVGKADFAPVLAILLIIFLSEMLVSFTSGLYQRLPLL